MSCLAMIGDSDTKHSDAALIDHPRCKVLKKIISKAMATA